MKLLNKKHFYIFMIIVFFIFTHKACASIFISEVGTTPDSEKFIELYNSGPDQNLTDWSIGRKTSSGKDYPLVSSARLKDKIIKSNTYFIIVNEEGYTGLTYDATWAKSYSIANDNNLYLYDNNKSVVSFLGWGNAYDCSNSCTGNPSDGQSIQKTSDGWVLASPTPGSENNNTQLPQEDTEESATESHSSPVSSSSEKVEEKIYKISTKIISPKIVVANIPFSIDHQTTGIHKEKVILGKFIWNFGDGMSKTSEVSPTFYYSYNYPGDYVLSLSFYDSLLNDSPDATDRVSIKVIPSGISISSVGHADDPFIELYNNSNYEMFLNGWVIKSLNKLFVIPDGTVVLPGKKIKFSPQITKFDYSDLGYLLVVDKENKIFASYPSTNSYNYSKTNSFNNDMNKKIPTANKDLSVGSSIDLNNMAAKALYDDNFRLNNLLPWALLLIVIIIGSYSVIMIKKKDKYNNYTEEDISVADIKIIE